MMPQYFLISNSMYSDVFDVLIKILEGLSTSKSNKKLSLPPSPYACTQRRGRQRKGGREERRTQ